MKYILLQSGFVFFGLLGITYGTFANNPSATISVSPCTIPDNGYKCDTTVSWSTVDATNSTADACGYRPDGYPTAGQCDISVIIGGKKPSGTSGSFTVAATYEGTYVEIKGENNTVLASTVVKGTCASGSVYKNGICMLDTSGIVLSTGASGYGSLSTVASVSSSAITATDCIIRVGEGSCTSIINLSGEASNSYFENSTARSMISFWAGNNRNIGSFPTSSNTVELTHGPNLIVVSDNGGQGAQIAYRYQTTANATCEAGSTWSNGKCINGSLSTPTQNNGGFDFNFAGCVIPVGQSTCRLPAFDLTTMLPERLELGKYNTTSTPLLVINEIGAKLAEANSKGREVLNAGDVIPTSTGNFGGRAVSRLVDRGPAELIYGANTLLIRKPDGTVVGTQVVYASCETGSVWKPSGTESRLVSSMSQLGTCVSSTGQNPFATTSSTTTTSSNPNAGSALPPPELIISRNYTRLLPGQKGSTNWITKNVDANSTLTLSCNNGQKGPAPLSRSGNSSTYDELVAGGWVGKIDCTWTLKGPGGTTVVKDSLEIVPRDQVTSTATTPVKTNTNTTNNNNTNNTNTTTNTTTSPTDTDNAIVIIRDTLSPDTSSLDAASKARIDKIIARVEKRVSAMIVENALKYLDSSIARIKALPNKNAKAKLIDTYTIEKLEDLRDTIAETETDYIGLIDTSLDGN